MTDTPRLTIELVPRPLWGHSLANDLPRRQWNRLRRLVYDDAGYRCETCGQPGRLTCHEIWAYDDVAQIQRLVRLIALCPACHDVKHIGRAGSSGRGAQALAQLCRVNGWTAAQAKAYMWEAIALYKQRSQLQWTTDLSALNQYKGRSAG